MDNGGFALSSAAGAGADSLREILKQKFLEAVQQQELAQQQRALEQQTADRAEGARRWNADHELRQASHRSLEDSRKAESEKDSAAVAKQQALEGQQREVFTLMGTPTWSQLTIPQRQLKLQGVGIHNTPLHGGIETADEHSAHVKADDATEFSKWKQRQDYSEQQLRSRPEKPLRGRLVADDPTLPRGSQMYALEIARKHGSDFQTAQQEALAYLADPETQRAHPNLSPEKFMQSVRRAASKPSGGGGSLEQRLTGIQTSVSGGGRGAGPGQLHRWSDGTTRAYPEQPSATPAASAKPGTVKLRAPDGSVAEVPEAEAQHYISRGATVIK